MKRLAIAVLLATSVVAAYAQGSQGTLPLEPAKERGASITPAYEGWYQNPDGTYSILFGYFNRNTKETIEIPIGPNNRIEPGNVDQGQPSYFEVGRQWGVFTIKVPKDFGTKKLTWTIVSNGETQSIPFALNKAYNVSPFKDLVMGNAPPSLAFSQGGAKVSGPPTGIVATLTGRANEPVTFSVWVEDVKGSDQGANAGRGRGGNLPIATVSLHKYRGPGTVTFDKPRLPAAKQGDMVSTTAKFSAPGEYVIRVQANDESGEGGAGFQCCWTNAHVKVTIE